MGVYQEQGGEKNWKKKKSVQIPAFGNWDYENELPITQYFETARQAGLIRFHNVSPLDEGGEYPIHVQAQAQAQVQAHANLQHLYALHFHSCNNYKPPKSKVMQAKEYRMQPLKKEKRSKKGDYLTEPPRPSNKNNRGGGVRGVPPENQKKKKTNIINVRAVDEDLYKIPPELLHSCKQKKRLGFFSRCLVPDCMV